MLRVFVISFLLINFLTLTIGVSFAGPQDWLKDAYTKSHQPGDGEPYSIDAEAKDMFKNSIDVVQTIKNVQEDGINHVDKNTIANSDSIFVRMTRYLSKIAVILAVPVLLYIAIKLALAFGDEGKMKDALKQVGYVTGGLLLVLLSVMIVYLIMSLARSNVKLF